MDIPATLLYLHAVPIPEDYDGRVLAETLDPDVMAQRPIRYRAGDGDARVQPETALGAEESDQVLRHLRGLGYLG
jgi:hypothetical protein